MGVRFPPGPKKADKRKIKMEREPITEKLKIPEVTLEQFEKLSMLDVNDPELLKIMEEKGIKFDQGTIKITVILPDGEKVWIPINTSREDFGTVVNLEGKLGEEAEENFKKIEKALKEKKESD